MSDRHFENTIDGFLLAKERPEWWNRAPVWNIDLTIPASLLKDADRDQDEPDQYGRERGED